MFNVNEFVESLPHTLSFHIELEDNPNYLNSKIGGSFYWPDENIPKFQFIAQINFSELPENDIFPSTGLLQFFIPENIFELSNNCLVIYHKEFDKGIEAFSLNKEPIKHEKKMKFTAVSEPLSFFDYRFKYDFDDKCSEQIYNLNNGEGHKLLGYPFFTQSDPRHNNYNTLLLQLDSCKDIMWGDCGVGNFFIDENKLKELDFSDVFFTWDCY